MRRYELTHGRTSLSAPMVVELHEQDCECAVCEPYRPSIPARLDAIALGRLTLAGIATGHAIAMLLWGPATVLRVLFANLTGTPL